MNQDTQENKEDCMNRKEPLLSVAPQNAIEDEHAIAEGYRAKGLYLFALAPFVVAIFFDTKFVIAAGFFILIVATHDVLARLLDLCIRLRRANVLLAELNGE
jgi:hypothetical protein